MRSGRKCSCRESSERQNTVAFYHKGTHTFSYHNDLLTRMEGLTSDVALWDYLLAAGRFSPEDAGELRRITEELTAEDPTASGIYAMIGMGTCRVDYVLVGDVVSLKLTCLSHSGDRGDRGDRIDRESARCDELTGLLSRNGFCHEVDRIRERAPEGRYAMAYFDLIRFKAVNDIFGFAEGDKLLIHIAACLSGKEQILAACRDSADRFAFLADIAATDIDTTVAAVMDCLASSELPFEIRGNVGIYTLDGSEESAEAILDKAILAQSAIKGSHTNTVNHYSDKLRTEMLSVQEIVGYMNVALETRQFKIHLQPQYNHSTGMIIGAEALVRWLHPDKGLISPGVFIPIFEDNGFIARLDFYVFEEACRFLRRSLDKNFSIVPISVNFTKHDIYAAGFVDGLEAIRKRYDVPAKYLRIEITESVLLGNARFVNEILTALHKLDYIIEMDDFGSGYSSLNVLKDLEFDIIKLDMGFLSDSDETGRGGTILSSIVNMAKWLGLPVIAEGVETVEQADFLRSIGCDYIQGYLYSKPLPEEEYEKLISASYIGSLIPQMNLIDTMNAVNFWDPASLETLIFSNFVGGAAIFSYDSHTHETDILRVNRKYLQELGMNLSERDIIHSQYRTDMDEKNTALMFEAIEKAISTADEAECDTWRIIHSECCGEEEICIRSTLRMLGKSDHRYIIYSMIRNVTAEKRYLEGLQNTERNFKHASEQAKIYFWEYTIATREMRPCFRCMRDLGFPPVLRNYPEPAIEDGVFPPEFADTYRDWHIQMANGAEGFEAIVPLTPDRVPFHVRYTTEFDENGHAIKAYGSATLVVDE